MTTWNTTYNFNQGNMSFGQAMLYGAFGQLTGMMGMGGCFGGYGMGSYGMGGLGMGGSLFSMMGMGGFGGYGMYNCGFSDGYVGAQVGMAAMSAIFQGIGCTLSARKQEKAAANAEVQAALTTLGLSSIDKFDPATAKSKAFKPETYNTKITKALNTKRTEISENISTLTKTESAFTAAAKTEVGAKLETETQEQYDKRVSDKAKELLNKYNEENIKPLEQKLEKIKTLATTITTSTSESLDEDIVGADVKAAIKEKEDKEKEIDAAIEVVQNAKIDSNKKDYNRQLKNGEIDNVKGSDGKEDSKKVEGKRLQDEFRAALKAFSNNKTEANKTNVKTKYNKLKEFATSNPNIITEGYLKTIDNAMNTYGLS